MITSRVWESGSRVERRVRVKDMFAGSLWLAVDYRLLRPRIVELRLIKGKVHQRDCIEWEELTGDWQTFRYLPLTQSGIPVEYREASDEVD